MFRNHQPRAPEFRHLHHDFHSKLVSRFTQSRKSNQLSVGSISAYLMEKLNLFSEFLGLYLSICGRWYRERNGWLQKSFSQRVQPKGAFCCNHASFLESRGTWAVNLHFFNFRFVVFKMCERKRQEPPLRAYSTPRVHTTYSGCSYEKTRAAKLLFPSTRWLPKLREWAGELAQGESVHSVSLRTCVWTPAPVPKSPV